MVSGVTGIGRSFTPVRNVAATTAANRNTPSSFLSPTAIHSKYSSRTDFLYLRCGDTGMTILVAGGAGYLGSRLVQRLHGEREAPVRVMDNMERERYCSLRVFDDGVSFYEGDTRNQGDVATCLQDVDTVFFLADLTNAGRSFEREEETRAVNYDGVVQLYEAAVEHGVEDFIYTSSASVYGDTPGVVDETFDCDPISPYGRYKLKAEQEMLARDDTHDMNTVALRLGTVYGYSVGMRFDTVVNYFTYLACQGKPLTVHETALDEYRPYVGIRDVIRAYLFAANNATSLSGKAYNVLEENRQMADVIDVMQDVFPDVDVVHVENPTENQVSYRLSDDRIASEGFETRHDMPDGVRQVKQQFVHLDTVQ